MPSRILVVEDNEIVREATLRYINSFGVNCYAVTTGEEAIELAEFVDLIFMDIDLPGINGVETARRIRKREEEKLLEPVTIVATTSGDNKLDCLTAGMNDFQQKPIYRNDVKRLIERWLFSKPQKERLLG